MKPTEFQALALRTEKTPLFVRVTGDDKKDHAIARMLHAVLGMMSEVGEIADQLKKHIIYGKDLDIINLIEEHGDESWYMNLLVDACNSTWEESWNKNIAKLRARYKGGVLTEEEALNRDLDAERKALEGAAVENATSLVVTCRQCNMLIDGLEALDVNKWPYEENVALREVLRTFKMSLLGQR